MKIKSFMKEIWLPVKGYEGLYEVSSFGRVRSLGNFKSNNSKVRVLKPGINKFGYLHVCLYKNGGKNMCLLHRLVAEAFIPNWFDEEQVNHRDENPKNNHIDNLEWCDRKYNCNYGTRIDRIREKRINGKCSKPILQLTKSVELIREFPSIKEAVRNGFDLGNIHSCCSGKRQTHRGYIWRYK